MSDLPAQLWTPAKFEGADLLPVKAQAAPTEELVGRENVDMGDLILPALKLLQGISDEVTQGQPGAIPGKFVNTLTGEIFTPPLRVLLVFHFKSRALFPRENNPAHVGLERCLSRDGVTGTVYGDCATCRHKEWGKGKGDAPACSEANNFVAMTAYGPASLRFNRTSFKAGRKFVTHWTMSNENLWAHPAVVRTRAEQREVSGKKATYFVMDLLWQVAESVPQSYRDAARQVFETCKAHYEVGKLSSADTGDEDREPDS